MRNEVIKSKLETIHEDITEIKRLVEKQNGRVRKLENWRSWLMGSLALIVLVLSWTVPTLARMVLE